MGSNFRCAISLQLALFLFFLSLFLSSIDSSDVKLRVMTANTFAINFCDASASGNESVIGISEEVLGRDEGSRGQRDLNIAQVANVLYLLMSFDLWTCRERNTIIQSSFNPRLSAVS